MGGELSNNGNRGDDFLAQPYREIPRRLRSFYQSLEDEALPDQLLELLEKLDQAEKALLETKEPLERAP